MQGQLTGKSLSVAYDTQCGHCGEPMQLEIDSDLGFRSLSGAEPLAFLPMVDFKRVKDPSIIDVF